MSTRVKPAPCNVRPTSNDSLVFIAQRPYRTAVNPRPTTITHFNLHRARREPQDVPLYVVEGFFDCMWLWQRGIRRVVALMGSTLSATQAALIQKITTPDSGLVVMFDEDDAGRAGREKAVARLSLHCFVRTHQFAQEGQQPDSLMADQVTELRAP